MAIKFLEFPEYRDAHNKRVLAVRVYDAEEYSGMFWLDTAQWDKLKGVLTGVGYEVVSS